MKKFGIPLNPDLDTKRGRILDCHSLTLAVAQAPEIAEILHSYH